MIMEYGFVYLWFDSKRKRFYVGCHWGTEDDGYICSSSWMLLNYKKHPEYFKRRILKTNISDKKLLLQEEYRWLSMIKKEELGNRYYNKHNHHFNHWSSEENECRDAIEKMVSTRKANGSYVAWNKGKPHSESHRKNLSISRKKNSGPNKGRKFSDEHRRKISEGKKGKVICLDRSGNFVCVSKEEFYSNNELIGMHNKSGLHSKKREEKKTFEQSYREKSDKTGTPSAGTR